MSDLVRLRHGFLRADISPAGAELHSLRSGDLELLWQAADPWRRHAPTLFPVICRVPDDAITVAGRSHPMPQHGFVRDLTFDVVEVTESTAAFVLVADDTTREHFPWDFALALRYELDDRSLRVTWEVENRAGAVMPFSLGWHPAFTWPLDEQAKELHRIEFERPESGEHRRVVDNLLDPEVHTGLVHDRTLELNPAIFADGAVILTDVASRDLAYAAMTGAGLHLAWEGFTGITAWSPPGGDFVCIEPWRGTPAPPDFTGEFLDKPDQTLLQPGARARFDAVVTVV